VGNQPPAEARIGHKPALFLQGGFKIPLLEWRARWRAGGKIEEIVETSKMSVQTRKKATERDAGERGNEKYICTLHPSPRYLCGFAGATHTYGTNLVKLFRNREIPAVPTYHPSKRRKRVSLSKDLRDFEEQGKERVLNGPVKWDIRLRTKCSQRVCELQAIITFSIRLCQIDLLHTVIFVFLLRSNVCFEFIFFSII